MIFEYRPSGVCSRKFVFDIDNDIIKSVEVTGGCNGNLQGISRLITNHNVDEIINTLKGVRCNGKPTSCPDQIAKALETYKIQANSL